MKQRVLYCTTIIIIVVAVIYFYTPYDRETNANSEVRLNILLENVLEQMDLERNIIFDSILLCSDENDTLTLSKLRGDKNLLVFFFKQTHCGGCIENELIKLKSIVCPEEYRILIISNENSKRYCFYLKRRLDIDSKIFFTSDLGSISFIKDIKRPVYFVLRKNEINGNHFLLIEPGMWNYSESYFKTVFN